MKNEIKEKPTPDDTIEIDVDKLKTSNIKINKIFKEKDDWFVEWYDIKEILNKLNNMMTFNKNLIGWQIDGNGTTISKKDFKILLDYITNLQEKSNNQAEEINRLYKQREKFMKKYGYLKEENERLEKRNKEIYDGFIATQEELSDYATRNEKAIKYIKEKTKEVDFDNDRLIDVLNILNGDDK